MKSAVDMIRSAQSGGSVPPGELAAAVDEVVAVTAETYTDQASAYEDLREAQPWEQDAVFTSTLLSLVRSRVAAGELTSEPDGRWKLLDVGAGYGRDVAKFSQEPDVAPFALENSPGFVEVLRRRAARGELPADSVIPGDMRDLGQIADASFQCVRNHATLHHLPLLHNGIGVDVAVEESRRILTPGGVFYVLVKAGDGVDVIDTAEGLGGRFFQLFTADDLEALLSRHRFRVEVLESAVEHRRSGDVDWLFALSVAV